MKKAFRWLHKPYETDFIIIEAPCNFLLSIFYFQIYHLNLWWNNPRTMASTCFHRSSGKLCDYVHTKNKSYAPFPVLTEYLSSDWSCHKGRQRLEGMWSLKEGNLKRRESHLYGFPPVHTSKFMHSSRLLGLKRVAVLLAYTVTEWSFCVAETPKN